MAHKKSRPLLPGLIRARLRLRRKIIFNFSRRASRAWTGEPGRRGSAGKGGEREGGGGKEQREGRDMKVW